MLGASEEFRGSLVVHSGSGLRDMDCKKASKVSGCCASKKYLDRLALSESGWVVGVGETSFKKSSLPE